MGIDLLQVIEQVGREKEIDSAVLIEAVSAAILSASRKTLGAALDLRVEFDQRSRCFMLYAVRKVVEQVVNPHVEIAIDEAQQLNPEAQLGDETKTELKAKEFGRIAAQTAKQVIIQRVKEAERESVFQAFKARVGELVGGVVQRVAKGNVIVNLGKAEAILPPREQLPREDYRVGDRIRAYVLDVKKLPRGSQIVLSRTHPGLLAKLLEIEVPEIYEGIVEIKAVSRDAGERAKVAVASRDSNVDPVGACVGYRGSRIQAIVRELMGEKIDVIAWKDDPASFVKSALAPADIESVEVVQETHTLHVLVADGQLSLAIGKRGQNARLAAKLLGWKVDVRGRGEIQKASEERLQPEFEPVASTVEGRAGTDLRLAEVPGVGEKLADRLIEAGVDSCRKLADASDEALVQVEGIGPKTAQKLIEAAKAALALRDAE
ncbi:MAG: transcription termination/antitermination protein NusA [Candidatus Methylomirabilis oxygeniifera]|uniref:Transcription termination/antitermination protein NusA n=1 Tax=Methylomirabilis oxygeniifera TaxID=671143 RepID=D5MKK0_METO1|nr:MAG: transcription termination/antitermination protein NusA [Candidatus Methylomirabilis oxyfera]CBE67647.1 Transcription elongation protein nusA (N utilization substance protein A) (L factor) [Candidatus Methylomirabilis oxyfera]